MGIVFILLAAVVIGIIVGVVIVMMNKKAFTAATHERADKLTDLDRRYLAIEEDLTLITKLGDGLKNQYPNADPEKIARAIELTKYFEKNWLARREQKWNPANKVSGATTYELDKSLTELEGLVADIFKAA
jgi:hypothetical protein